MTSRREHWTRRGLLGLLLVAIGSAKDKPRPLQGLPVWDDLLERIIRFDKKWWGFKKAAFGCESQTDAYGGEVLVNCRVSLGTLQYKLFLELREDAKRLFAIEEKKV